MENNNLNIPDVDTIFNPTKVKPEQPLSNFIQPVKNEEKPINTEPLIQINEIPENKDNSLLKGNFDDLINNNNAHFSPFLQNRENIEKRSERGSYSGSESGSSYYSSSSYSGSESSGSYSGSETDSYTSSASESSKRSMHSHKSHHKHHHKHHHDGEEERKKKREIMIKFSKYEKRGHNVPLFKFNDRLEEMEFALDKFEQGIKFDKDIKFYRIMIIGVSYIIEKVANRLGGDLGLEGWWKHVKKNVGEYDEYLEEMVKEDSLNVHPMIRLSGALMMSAMTYSAMNNIPSLTRMMASQAGEVLTALGSGGFGIPTQQQPPIIPKRKNEAEDDEFHEMKGPSDIDFLLDEIKQEKKTKKKVKKNIEEKKKNKKKNR